MKKYWLLKSKPDVYPFSQLKKDGSTGWSGVRNYQARNFMRDAMQTGDGVLFYHSSADPKAIIGTAKVVRAGVPDPTQFDKNSEYYDAKSSRENPAWVMAEIAFEREFARAVTLDELKKTPGLEKMMVVQRGARLSVQPVTEAEWKFVLKLGAKA